MTIPEPPETAGELLDRLNPGVWAYLPGFGTWVQRWDAEPEPAVQQLPPDDPMSIKLSEAIDCRSAREALLRAVDYALVMWDVNADTPANERQARDELAEAYNRAVADD